MLKLTRLNHQVVAINPDHIGWADASPDTTLTLLGGDRILVRESLDELIEKVIEFRRRVRRPDDEEPAFPTAEGDPPRVPPPRRLSEYPRRQSGSPREGGR